MGVLQEFKDHREIVINYIKDGIIRQGGSVGDAIMATSCIMFFRSNDIENMYRCITSDLPKNVIEAIIAHDYNGLSSGPDRTFLPKSTQFKDKEVADALSS